MNKSLDTQSVKIRFFATFLANITKAGLGFLGGVIIARALGPSGYGNYSFLLGSFGSIVSFFDMGTTSAFYTFISMKKRSLRFYSYYLVFVMVQFIVILSLISIIFPDSWRNKIWLGQPKQMIILAFLASFMMNTFWLIFVRAGESIRATITVQLYNIILVCFYLGAILALTFLHALTIANLFIAGTILYCIFSFMLANRLRKELFVPWKDKLSDIVNDFRVYCSPFFIYIVAGFLYSFADVWLLQKFAGATQQGFYSIGFRFSSICLLAATSILNVFWKEIAAANEAGNKERLYKLYTKISRALCFISAMGACFLVPFSRELLVFFLGEKYAPGWFCLSIMFFYPIHQSIGQINGSYFLATGKTGLYSRIGVSMMIVSVPVTYFLLAPVSSLVPGLSLGSVGLALKMVILQIIGVNMLGYFLCKASGWKFDFLYQFKVMGYFLAVSFGIKLFLQVFSRFVGIAIPPLVLPFIGLPFYIAAAGGIIFLSPQLAGLERSQLIFSRRLNNEFKS